MLKRIYVRNYALIKELELDFDKGLTIITGETGAGKSILLGALGLVLGQRADSNVLLDKESKCVVEASFRLESVKLEGFFEENDLDYSKNCILRREINSGGRSRAFINDTPVNLDHLKELGNCLIDIHSQHQTLMLGKNKFQLTVIDSFAKHSNLLETYAKYFGEYKSIEAEIDELSSRAEQDRADLEYYNHQLIQLDEAGLKEGEVELLENERDLLLHSGEVHDALSSLVSFINNEDNSVVAGLNDIKRQLERINEYLPESETYAERLESTIIELNDLANEADRKSSSIEADPVRLEFISSRLDTLFGLLQRHRVEKTEDLISIREKLRLKVDEISFSDEKLTKLRKRFDELENQLSIYSIELSDNRKSIADKLEKRMNTLLSSLGMPNGRFAVAISQLQEFGPEGSDQVEFLFSANKQVLPVNLSRVASGGELSRLMLSLKSLLTDNNRLPTIFFDEIDSGVSGEVATKVGEILATMGKSMQVINITHLPQVAALGEMHYYVFKEDEGNSTITHIKLLDKKQKLNEIARLLSGNEITEASIENAKELINGK